MTYLLLLAGFILLVKGADYFVSGSSAIARYFHIPAFIIGLTIVALGTSLPEAAISVTAAIRGANGITMGNALGSNLFNLLVVLGASSVIKTCPVSKDALRFEYPLSIFAAALILLLGASFSSSDMVLSRADGLVLLIVLAVFLVMAVRRAMKERQAHSQGLSDREVTERFWSGSAEADAGQMCSAGEEQETEKKKTAGQEEADAGQPHEDTGSMRENAKGKDGGCEDAVAQEAGLGSEVQPGRQEVSLPKGVLYVIAGAAAIIFGGDIVVDSATAIAEAFGIDETLIGLTVVAFGTSLPELVTSVVAAVKGETDIAVGNVIGSNLFNLLMVLGLSVSIHPISISLFAVYDLSILIIASLIVLIPLAKNQALTRGWGILLLALYGVYLAYIIMRAM